MCERCACPWDTSEGTGWLQVIAYVTALIIGFTLPAQTNMNVRLGKWTRSPLLATLISFALSTVLLVVALMAAGLSGANFGNATDGPAWLWIGGLCGVVFLVGNILLLPRLGAVQTVVLPVLGQIVAGLVIDTFGLFESAQSAFTFERALGGILVAVGVILVSVPRGKNADTAQTGSGGAAWLWRALAVIIGMFSSVQTAVNGRLGALLGSPLEASLISFIVGTTTLVIIVAVLAACGKLRNTQDKGEAAWWMWLGGILGVLFVYCSAALAASIGTGSTVIIMLAGSIAGGVLIDSFGLLGSDRKPMTLVRTVGLLVLFVGVALVRFV